MINIPAPVAETRETVTLTRADWEVLVAALDDAADLAAIEAHGRDVAAGTARHVPGEVVVRLVDGEVPARAWREHRGISQRDLAARAGVSVTYLCEIELGKKPGSAEALAKIARALEVDVEDLLRRQRA